MEMLYFYNFQSNWFLPQSREKGPLVLLLSITISKDFHETLRLTLILINIHILLKRLSSRMHADFPKMEVSIVFSRKILINVIASESSHYKGTFSKFSRFSPYFRENFDHI